MTLRTISPIGTSLPVVWLLVAALIATVGCASDDGGSETSEITVSGHAFNFSMEGGRLAGGIVSVLELPERVTTTAADGGWRLSDLPANRDLTFVLTKDGWTTTQTATFRADQDFDRVTFQVPDTKVFALMAQFVDSTPDPTKCQLASTVTRRGHSVYDGSGTHGEPGATVTSEPPVKAEVGPVYFNLVTYNVIFPDPKLKATSDDGGVVWANVEPGEYVLHAHKDGATFEPVLVKCRPGVLVNPSPPRGLQVLSGGLEPKH